MHGAALNGGAVSFSGEQLAAEFVISGSALEQDALVNFVFFCFASGFSVGAREKGHTKETKRTKKR